MRLLTTGASVLLLAGACLAIAPAAAGSSEDAVSCVEMPEERIRALEARVRSLERDAATKAGGGAVRESAQAQARCMGKPRLIAACRSGAPNAGGRPAAAPR